MPEAEFTETQYFRNACSHFGITEEEGKRRHDICLSQGDNPEDPICIGCAKRPGEIEVYQVMADDGDPVAYVIEEEGTFNTENGHFLCDECYIANGMPSGPDGWICP